MKTKTWIRTPGGFRFALENLVAYNATNSSVALVIGNYYHSEEFPDPPFPTGTAATPPDHYGSGARQFVAGIEKRLQPVDCGARAEGPNPFREGDLAVQLAQAIIVELHKRARKIERDHSEGLNVPEELRATAASVALSCANVVGRYEAEKREEGIGAMLREAFANADS